MRKKEKFIVLDVETANSVDDGLVYDLGFVVTDRNGKIYSHYSFCIYDIYVLEKELMQSAYYAEKLPLYEIGLKNGDYKLVNFLTAKKIVAKIMKENNIKKVFAFNCFFDKTMLNTTLRYITKSEYRWFFPYGTEFHDIWNFACSTICQKKSYKDFCELNGFISNKGKNYRATAETIFAYLSNSDNYKEKHQGLEDVYIETYILAECYKSHQKVMTHIDRLCWKKVTR